MSEKRGKFQFHWFAEQFPILDDDALASLAKDIRDHKQQFPIIVDQDGVGIDGRNRAIACALVGVEPIVQTKHFKGEAEILRFIWSANSERRHLSSSQKAALGLTMLPALEEEAAERKRAGQARGGKTGGRGRNSSPEEIPESYPDEEEDADTNEARTQAAELVGTNPRYISDAKKLQDEAPELLEQVRTGEKSIPKAMNELKDRQDEPLLVIDGTPDEETRSKPKFNKTNENIDWAKWSWNPVTGCEHTCSYCYARDIANRFYKEKFQPTFRPERLTAPKNTPLPKTFEHGERNVFVCSMADLFGEWVPQTWIDAVMSEVRNARDWNFLFLTKNPKRLVSIKWPDNAWVGTTVDINARVRVAEMSFAKIEAPVKWLSCEPMLEELKFTDLSMFDWVVIGAQSKSTQEPEFQPPKEWVLSLMTTAWNSGCKVYCKPNLRVVRDYPSVGRK